MGLGLKSSISILIIIFVGSFVIFPSYAQEEVICEKPEFVINQDKQCVPACGEGLELKGNTCVEEEEPTISEFGLIVLGVLVGIIATVFGTIWTIKQRKAEMQREDLAITQQYGQELSQIMDSERDLKTKLECSLYAEKYLELLEQIASLYKKGQLRKNVADYFENTFCYGITLKRWYSENIYTEEQQENRWDEFEWWCKGAVDEITRKANHPPLIGFDQRVLPEIMTQDFELIPEEDGLTKGEFVEIIRSYGNDLGKLSEKERELDTQLDCSVYVEQYLDILEEVASLYKSDIIPKKAADYFENKFSYGRNLWDWYEKFVDLKKSADNPPKYSKKSDDEIIQVWNANDQNDRWREFKWWCEGGKQQEGNKITAFSDDMEVDEEGIQVGKVLPGAMYYYDELPEDDGVDPAKLLDIITSYGRQLTDITDKERYLKTKLDCTVYVEQYLDILEQIAYLFNSKALATDVPTYFENNFSYGLTLRDWYVEKLGEEVAQANTRWSDFKKYTDEWEKVNGEFVPLEKFPENKLPDTMIKYFDPLPEDLVEEAKRKEEKASKDAKKK